MAPLGKPDLRRWRTGNTGVEGVWRFDSGRPGRALLVTALIHGNEVCGAWALLDVLQHGLRPHSGSLTLAFCNLEAFDRSDGIDPQAWRFTDEDMNRVWGPSLANVGGRSSELRRAKALRRFVESADWLLDLHSMHEPGPALALVGASPQNIELVKSMGAPQLIVADAGHAAGRRLRDHGPFGDEASASGKLAVLIECGFHADASSRDVALDSVARFFEASGAFAANATAQGWRRLVEAPQRLLAVTDAVVVADGDPPRFSEQWVSGQTLPVSGTLVAWTGGQPVHTPYDRCVLIMPSLHYATPGATLVRMAKDRSDLLHSGVTT